MEIRDLDVAPLGSEVQEMIEPDVIRQIRELTARGWGSKRIAAELGVARNTVRRYLRGGAAAEAQVRVNQAGCLDRCELGPTIVIYPDGVWYRATNNADIDEILEKHVGTGERVARLMLKPEYGPPQKG